jgi:hypothetical protein
MEPATPATDATDADDPRLLLLSPRDNVFVCREDIAAGTRIRAGGVLCVLQQPVLRGHKIARTPIGSGDKVLKYGAPVGSATIAISPGDHVHVHNVRSDYTPSHFFDHKEGTTQ